jgi:hypothetical protein
MDPLATLFAILIHQVSCCWRAQPGHWLAGELLRIVDLNGAALAEFLEFV